MRIPNLQLVFPLKPSQTFHGISSCYVWLPEGRPCSYWKPWWPLGITMTSMAAQPFSILGSFDSWRWGKDPGPYTSLRWGGQGIQMCDLDPFGPLLRNGWTWSCFFNLSLFIILELYAMINYNIFIYTYTCIYIYTYTYIYIYKNIYTYILSYNIYYIYYIYIIYIILYIYIYIIYIYIILYIDYIYLYLNITKASNRSANACETLVAANPGSSNWKWRQSTPRVAARDC